MTESTPVPEPLAAGDLPSAYGGPGWSPRRASHRDEIGGVWAPYRVRSEWAPLEAVLLHRPGPELAATDPGAVDQLAPVDVPLATAQHDALAAAYRDVGVEVHLVDPPPPATPNQMFVADLMFMTPAGAIVARPASTVRAGEARPVARRLADLGVPILRTVAGTGTFEGADAMWLDEATVLVGVGLRTNVEGAAQVEATLAELGVAVVRVDLPVGTMHLMGMVRIVGPDLAVVWPHRLAWRAVEALRSRGYRILTVPDPTEAVDGHALNVVTLGPGEILMPAGNPVTQGAYEAAGITVRTVDVSELINAAGAVGCLTGILSRA